MMGWYHDGAGGAGWLVMTLAMLAFWVLVVGAVVLLLRDSGRSRTPASATSPDPLRILDERFALGQIGPEEYRERRAVLTHSQYDRSQYDRSQHDRSQYDRSQYDRSQHDRSQHHRSQHHRPGPTVPENGEHR